MVHKKLDLSYHCTFDDSADYVFVPVTTLHPNYVVGTNTHEPIYSHTSVELRERYLVPALPTGLADTPSFTINERGRHGFGTVYVTFEEREDKSTGDVNNVFHNYDNDYNFRESDEIVVTHRYTGIYSGRINRGPLRVIL